MPASPSITTFANLNPPWSLSALDANFSSISALLKSANNYSNYLVDTGVANTYVVNFPAGVTFTLTAGLTVSVLILNSNTGSSTLNVGGSGAVLIERPNAQPLSSGDLIAGSVQDFTYDGTEWILKTFTPASIPSNASGAFVIKQFFPFF